MRGLRVAVLTPHYPPETGAAAQRVQALAEGLEGAGHEVTVYTLLPHHPQHVIRPDFDRETPMHTIENGVHIVRLRPRLLAKAGLAWRLVSEALFAVATFRLAVARGFDLIVASSPYMFLGPSGWAAARVRRARFLWDVRDLTWLYPRASGKRTFGLDRPLEWLMRRTAQRADAVSTATDGLLRYFEGRTKIAEVVPNGVSDRWLEELLRLPPALPDAAPTVVYAGLLGFSQDLSTVVRAARRLPDVSFVFAGDGPEAPALRALADSMGATNVSFVGQIERPTLLDLYRRATLLVGHVVHHPIHGWTEPSKLWEYLATERPVVHGGLGDIAELLTSNAIGRIVTPSDDEALATAIRAIQNDPREAAAMARRGRAYVEQNRRRSRSVDAFVQLVETVAD